jgi:hypothetical protein
MSQQRTYTKSVFACSNCPAYSIRPIEKSYGTREWQEHYCEVLGRIGERHPYFGETFQDSFIGFSPEKHIYPHCKLPIA